MFLAEKDSKLEKEEEAERSNNENKKNNKKSNGGGNKKSSSSFYGALGGRTSSVHVKNHELLKNSPLYADLVNRGIDITDYELNPAFIRVAPLTDEQMIRVMGGTLRHAASSIFVTSFTTAAAFFTNYITKLPSVQLFGKKKQKPTIQVHQIFEYFLKLNLYFRYIHRHMYSHLFLHGNHYGSLVCDHVRKIHSTISL